MGFNLYGAIILVSIIAGTVAANVLGLRCGIKRRTLFYTAFFIFFSIVIFAVTFVFLGSGGKNIGVSGLGGVFGLMIGIIFSVYVHEDHPRELFASWVISAPLMYSIAKVACMTAGCCSGELFGISVRIIDCISYMLIYIASLTLFIREDNKMRSAYTAMILSFVARFVLDFFRDSHSGRVISSEQIMILVAGGIAMSAYILRKKIPMPKSADNG